MLSNSSNGVCNFGVLKFSSCFESGNLKYVMRKNGQYLLVLDSDTNSRGHTQWFYFAVRNTTKGQTETFNMMNLSKSNSLYNQGMLPLVYSKREEERMLTDPDTQNRPFVDLWKPGGQNVAYAPNYLARWDESELDDDASDKKRRASYYSFSFDYTFEHDNDVVYFAYSIPYTYTQMQFFLNGILPPQLVTQDDKSEMSGANPLADNASGTGTPTNAAKAPATPDGAKTKLQGKARFVRRKAICHSIGKLRCEMLTITNYQSTRTKKTVVLSARVHPGETNASWMMHGLIEFLTSDHVEAQVLREWFVFRIVPMLNPDGVVVEKKLDEI